MTKTLTQMRTIALAAALLVPFAAAAQGKLYKWVDATGKVHYTDKVPTEASGVAREQLSKQGTVVRRVEAPLTAEQREQLEQERQRKLEADLAAKEEKRKNMALLNTYSSERDIEDARTRALQDNAEALKSAQRKLDEAMKRQAKLKSDAEFYQKKPMPRQLVQDMQVNDLDIKTQTELLDTKQKEVAQINAKYDEDKRRFIALTEKPAGATTAAAETVRR